VSTVLTLNFLSDSNKISDQSNILSKLFLKDSLSLGSFSLENQITESFVKGSIKNYDHVIDKSLDIVNRTGEAFAISIGLKHNLKIYTRIFIKIDKKENRGEVLIRRSFRPLSVK